MNKSKRWNDEQFTNAVKESTSIRQVLTKLGLANQGGGYNTVHRNVKRLNLDTSHFSGKGWSKGKIAKNNKSVFDYLLLEGPPIDTYKLKKKLIKENLLINKCKICDINSWLEKDLVLHLDHKNGNKRDNRINNLQLLCPNCHSQTDDYCGKNNHKATY